VLKVAPQYYYTVRTGEILVNQLAKVGIKVRMEQIEWGQWLAQVYREANFDMSIIGHAEPWDIHNYANPKYYFRWDHPEFQKLFRESEITVADAPRRELYAKMQRLLAEEAPVVWLYVHPRLVVTKKGVTGIWKHLPVPALDLAEVAWQTP
jgi:peptide/nickel transport system substrate-binding protein